MLAGGGSTRMGRPKATLPWSEGGTFVSVALERMREVALSPLILVCGEHLAETKAVLPTHVSPLILQNPDPSRGQLSSLKIALRELRDETSIHAVLVSLVDHPGVKASTLRALLDRASPASIVVPRRGDRRGHPVVFGRDVFSELLDTPDEKGARPVVRRDPDRVSEVLVEDEAVLLDIDTPEDLEEAARTR